MMSSSAAKIVKFLPSNLRCGFAKLIMTSSRTGLHTSSCLRGRFVYYNIHRKCTKPEQQDENHFENEALKIDFGPGCIDKLCEIWKEKMYVQRELLFKKDDRLVKHDSNYWLPKLEPGTPKLEYQNVSCLKDAPESVKKIFSIEYGERNELTALYKNMIIERVRTNALDGSREDDMSLEAQIAKRTANIRQWTMLLESMEKKPGWLRKMIRMSIEKRRKLLRFLRQQNLESFENVLKQLKIAYHVPPLPEDLPIHTRKGWVEFIVKKKCELVKEEKLRRYHATLKKDHETFRKQRDEAMVRLKDEYIRLKNDVESLRTEEDQPLTVAGQYVGDTIGEVSEHLMHFWFYKKPPKQKTVA